ncbi:MAG TPA: phosphatidylglycerophosphatase A [Candidatus Ozemobacteraceae bacterium]|nr:phosphatidylglycerophosphatase A [Candidatus Ozemobacteraceae bacterium]
MTTSSATGTCSTSNTACGRLLDLLSAGGGFGYIPFASGTWGSLPGIAIFLLTRELEVWLQIVLFVLVSLAAIGLADRSERLSGIRDPNFVVIDEVVGMWATLLFLWRADPIVLVAGFLLFRAFDILKFYPLNVFEAFRGGVGIVLDDLAAGMLANIVMRLVLLSGVL